MPRKPKPPEDFVIEGIESGERVYSMQPMDDFEDGKAIERPKLAPRAKHVRVHTQDERAKQRMAEAQRRQEQAPRMADDLVNAMRDMIDPPKRKPFKRRF
jgi:hypothetical protein